MTRNRRIALNVVATYGRTLFSVALGIFSGRWILAALGEVDFGLLGVVGGMLAFITFINAALAEATGRFYAFSIGKAKADVENGLDECQRWFNVALFLHIVVPSILMAIGWPAGEWMVRSFLNIPDNRVLSCIWVWRFACIACFIGMANIPFRAMYVAKQYIAELTLYGIARTAVNFCFIYYMSVHPDDWLVKYAGWTCLIGITPSLLICIRALVVFPECRIRSSCLWSPRRMKELGAFAGWHTLGSFSFILRNQGESIIVNKFFGPGVNAAFSLANSVDGQINALSGAMRGAFQPAIVQAYGANDLHLSRTLANVTSKFCLSTTLFFAIPFFLEGGQIMKLWLVHPPAFVTGLCVMFVISDLVDKSTTGHILAINATGKVSLSQTWEAVARLICVVIAFIFCITGFGPYSVGCAYILASGFFAVGRIYCARKNMGMSAIHWLRNIVLPAICLTFVSLGAGATVRCWLEESVLRILCSSICAEIPFLLGIWLLMFDDAERAYVLKYIRTHWLRRSK